MIEDFYDKTFTVEKPSTGRSSMGAMGSGWTTVGTFIGFMDLVTGGSFIVGAQYLDRATHIIGCSSTNSWVLTNHRIKDPNNLYFNVLNNDDPVGLEHHREILIEFKGANQLST